MARRIKFTVEPDFVIPKVEDDSDRISSLFGDAFGDLLPNDSVEPPDPQDITEESGLQWREWTLGIDLSQFERLSESSQAVLEKLDDISQIFVIILKILRVFTSSFKSLTRALKVVIKSAVNRITETIESLASTGGYVAPIVPDFDERSPVFKFPINGGFEEFKSRVSATCLNDRDPNAPKFRKNDQVGGWVITMGAGSNDTELISNIIENFNTLSKFFGFKNPMPAPPRYFKAVPGFYRRLGDGSTDKKLGVKLTWERPVSPITGFQISRSKDYKGSIHNEVIDGKRVTVRKYDNEDFNNNEPVVIRTIPGRLRYEYIDFEVEDNQPYYYIVHSTAGFEFFREGGFFERVASPLSTQPIGVVPRNCIPISELQRYLTLDEDGNPVNPEELESEWVTVTVRSLLGNQIDQLLNLLEKTSEKLLGIVSTPSDAINDYIDFYQKRIRGYMNTVNKIANIIQRVSSYKLQGSLLFLDIPIEEGGIEGFVDRFNSASIDEQFVNLGQGNQAGGNITAISDVEGIFVGVVVLWGFPNVDENSKAIDYIVPPDEREDFSNQIERSKKAIDTIKSLLGLE